MSGLELLTISLYRWDTMDIFMQHDIQELSRVVNVCVCNLVYMMYYYHINDLICTTAVTGQH